VGPTAVARERVRISVAARRGACFDLAVIVPVVAAYTALHGSGAITGDSGVIVTAVLAGLVAPVVAGVTCARTGGSPRDCALAAGLGTLAYVAFRCVDAVIRSRPVNVPSLVILEMLSVVLAVCGGLVTARRAGRS
jgi:hypothetical protein